MESAGHPAMVTALLEGKTLPLAVETLLRSPVVVVLDEAQRLLKPGSGAPMKEFASILKALRNRPQLPGRLLLLTDRRVERARWSEWIPTHELPELDPDEAAELLDNLLSLDGNREAIPTDRIPDILKALSYNPRAIETLVGALAFDTLDDIIGDDPGLWDIRDREVSREFVAELERELLSRTMGRLEPLHRSRLLSLAVHRRSFRKTAVEGVCGSGSEAREVVRSLVARFLMSFHLGSHTMNPIVREISLMTMRATPADLQRAHSHAGDYHLRPFGGRRIVDGEAKLGASFAETRYHLTQAGGDEDLSVIAHRFSAHLSREINWVSPVPTNAELLTERIAILSALLSDPGAKSLEYQLARCLRARGRTGDLDRAIPHAGRSLGNPSRPEAWVLCAQLEEQAGKRTAAVRTIRSGIGIVPPDKGLQPLYQIGAEILARADKSDEAVELLRQGIEEIPSDKSLQSLYQSAAEILARDDKSEDAVELLRQGIEEIPPDKNLFALYQSAGEILDRDDKSEDAVELLRQGIEEIPPDKNLFALYQSAGEILARADKSDEAVELLKRGIKGIPADKNLFSLYQSAAEILSRDGQSGAAVELLRQGIEEIPPGDLLVLYEELGEVHCRAGRPQDAIIAYDEGARRVSVRHDRHRLVVGSLLVRLGVGDGDGLVAEVARLAGDSTQARQWHYAQVLLHMNDGAWSSALGAATSAREQNVSYFALTMVESFLLLATGDPHGALATLGATRNLTLNDGGTDAWLSAFIHLRLHDLDAAKTALSTYLGRPVDLGLELNEAFLLRLWDGQVSAIDNQKLCYHFPIMPEGLTRRSDPIRRVPYSPPVLGDLATPSADALALVKPDIYVSYAWGEDKTEEGHQRDDIVNRLCDAVRAQGRLIGRDKDDLRAGDSIDRFAKDIARAERIVAVISAKSLRSHYCMVDELFRAYQRCAFQSDEFKTKVIALVMDDATTSVTDLDMRLDLATEWNKKLTPCACFG
jgi:tetratricopeptide (TPR) repeat protein